MELPPLWLNYLWVYKVNLSDQVNVRRWFISLSSLCVSWTHFDGNAGDKQTLVLSKKFRVIRQKGSQIETLNRVLTQNPTESATDPNFLGAWCMGIRSFQFNILNFGLKIKFHRSQLFNFDQFGFGFENSVRLNACPGLFTLLNHILHSKQFHSPYNWSWCR